MLGDVDLNREALIVEIFEHFLTSMEPQWINYLLMYGIILITLS